MAANNVPNQKKDYITNRVLVIFSVCMASFLGLMYLSSLLDSMYYMTGLTIANGIRIAGVVLVIVGIALYARNRHMGVDTSTKVILGHYLAIYGALLAVMMTMVTRYGLTMFPLCYGVLIGIAFLYLIFHSYPNEFFAIAADCALAAALLTLCTSSVFTALLPVALLVLVVAMGGQLLLVQRMKANGNKLVLGKIQFSRKFSDNAYKMLTITPIVMAVVTVAGAFGGSMIAYIAYGAIATYFVVTCVYYTVKMM